ncbi:MAG: NAD(P)/FAD-dependent oxidoreductase [Planctomycetaceae bacterium]|nr:NAD(P)/FAD-dependent oxidoreductase [Planctomycetaceae bacterium]
MAEPHRVVIIGGGFGGLNAARALRHAPVEVTLIDRRNFHLFQPLLYQVATGGLSPANIAAPLRAILEQQANARVILGEVSRIDLADRSVQLGGEPIPFDTLVVAAGAQDSYFGHDDWEELAPGLKSLEDATEIRGRVLSAFEEAELSEDLAARQSWLDFVVVGGGPTGVELAGAIAELARHTLKNNFRRIDPAAARIVLIEGEPQVLPSFSPKLRLRAQRSLAQLGVTLELGARVVAISPTGVTVRRGDEVTEIPARTVLWAAGVRANPLGRQIAEQTGTAVDRGGRLIVGPDCTVAGRPEVFVIGDLAAFQHGTERPLPGLAPVAIQQGRYVARAIRSRLAGREVPPFKYRDRGSMATIGRARAVAAVGPLEFGGILAWLAWLFIHLLFLVGFQNRLLVLVQWAINYFTRNRAARLITGEPAARFADLDLPAARAADR